MYIFICSNVEMTWPWYIKTVHKQVQSKTYKAQAVFTATSTTNTTHIVYNVAK